MTEKNARFGVAHTRLRTNATTRPAPPRLNDEYGVAA